MRMPEVYEMFLGSAAELAPSIVIALLPADAPEPDVSGVQALLRESGLAVDGFEIDSAPRQQGAVWRQTAVIGFPDRDDPMRVDIWLEKAPEDHPPTELEIGLTDDERAEIDGAKWVIGTETQFGERALWDYHRQLQIIAAAAPEATIVVDPASTAVHSAAWVRDVASSSVPPSPLVMFRMHAVGPDEGGNGWLHTHGLLRCGTVELEMVDIPPVGSESLGDLMNAVAMAFLDLGTPPPGETFAVGQGLELVWLPWEDAIRHVPKGMWSADEDREQGHNLPSGILLRPKSGLFIKRYGNPAKYARSLQDNPVLQISTTETDRMAALAKERFERFARVHKRFGGDTDDWVFLVKLGLPIDNPAMLDDGDDEPMREHLWFRIHSITGNQVDATLINEPYGISTLHEGDRGSRSLEHMSDWAILSERGRFDPDQIFHLERALAAEDTPA